MTDDSSSPQAIPLFPWTVHIGKHPITLHADGDIDGDYDAVCAEAARLSAANNKPEDAVMLFVWSVIRALRDKQRAK